MIWYLGSDDLTIWDLGSDDLRIWDLGSEDLRSWIWGSEVSDLRIWGPKWPDSGIFGGISFWGVWNDLILAILPLLAKTAIMHYLPKTPKRCRRSACIFQYSCFHPFGPFWVFWIIPCQELVHFHPFLVHFRPFFGVLWVPPQDGTSEISDLAIWGSEIMCQDQRSGWSSQRLDASIGWMLVLGVTTT